MTDGISAPFSPAVGTLDEHTALFALVGSGIPRLSRGQGAGV